MKPRTSIFTDTATSQLGKFRDGDQIQATGMLRDGDITWFEVKPVLYDIKTGDEVEWDDDTESLRRVRIGNVVFVTRVGTELFAWVNPINNLAGRGVPLTARVSQLRRL